MTALVELFPPLTSSSITYPDGPVPMHAAPPFIRSRDARRRRYWHRPRSGTDYGTHAALHAWCGQTFFLSRIDTTPAQPDGDPICGTCTGRAIGAGQLELEIVELGELAFTPRHYLPPDTCPGRSTFVPLDRRLSHGRCLACGAVERIGGGSRGGYGWSTVRLAAHPYKRLLVDPCPFHGWSAFGCDGETVVCTYCGGYGAHRPLPVRVAA